MTVVEHTPETLLSLARNFMQSRILITGAELDLFTLLAPAPLTTEEIVRCIGGQHRPMTVLLDALVALGFLLKEDERYRTTPLMIPLLSSDSPRSVLPMVLHASSMWKTWSNLTQIVKETGGPPRATAESRSDRELRAFIGGMHVMGSAMADRIVTAIQPGSARSILDVGCGPGTYALAFLRASPSLRATLFDKPAVLEIARGHVESAGMLERASLVGGDFCTDVLPQGHDLVLLSAIIHMNSLTQNVDLYRKIHPALVPGGRLIIRDHVMHPERTAPVAGAIFAINMLVATPGGGTYTFEEIKAGLTEAGFTRVRLIQEGERMDGLVEAIKP